MTQAKPVLVLDSNWYELQKYLGNAIKERGLEMVLNGTIPRINKRIEALKRGKSKQEILDLEKAEFDLYVINNAIEILRQGQIQ